MPASFDLKSWVVRLKAEAVAMAERLGFLMSRGAGNLQRSLTVAFRQPAYFTVKELAVLAFPGEPIVRKHLVSVR